MKRLRERALFSIALAAALAGCGGGGASGGSGLPATRQAGGKTMSLHFSGSGTLSSVRQTQNLAGTSVSVPFNGKIVATGTLDSNGAVMLNLEDIPPGSTVQITAGTTTVTTVIAATAEETVVSVQLNPDGTLTVTSSTPNGTENENEVEDHQGNPTEVNDDNGAMLPSNLPFTVSRDCATITLAPKGATLSRLIFEEKTQNGDSTGTFKFDGAFSSAKTFPIVGAAARLHIIVFDQTGKQLLEVKEPVTAFTPTGATTTPAPCPTLAPTSAPSPTTSPTATPH